LTVTEPIFGIFGIMWKFLKHRRRKYCGYVLLLAFW